MKSMKLPPFLINATVSRYVVPAIILLHLGITVTLSKMLNVWLDEAFSLYTTQGGIGQTIIRALNFEEQPPVYFALLNIWRNINNSYFFARSFSVLCILLTLIVFATMSKKLLKDIHPGWITAVVAFNPFIIWAATEIRCYALVILISALLCKFFVDAYLSENPVSSAKWYYALLSVCALYTFYFLGVLLVANAFALLILKRWRSLRTYLISMLGVAICFAPMAWVVLNQASSVIETAESFVTIWAALKWIHGKIIRFILPNLCIGIVVGSFFVLRKKRSEIVPETIAYLTILFILYILNVAVFMFVGGMDGLYYRHTLYILPPLILCLFLVLDAVAGKKNVIICSLIMLFLSASASIVKFTPPIKWGDWAHVASYVSDSEKPGQPVLVYLSVCVWPLALHYTGINDIVPIRNRDHKAYSSPDVFLNNEIELSQIVFSALNDCQRFWLVTNTLHEHRGVRYSHDALLEIISKKYSIVTTKTFHGSIVRFMLRKDFTTQESGTSGLDFWATGFARRIYEKKLPVTRGLELNHRDIAVFFGLGHRCSEKDLILPPLVLTGDTF